MKLVPLFTIEVIILFLQHLHVGLSFQFGGMSVKKSPWTSSSSVPIETIRQSTHLQSVSEDCPDANTGVNKKLDIDMNTDMNTEIDMNISKESLENDMQYIEALEERNKAQIYSFIDEQDQWDSMEESERELLLRKDFILEQLEKLEQKGSK
jgi:preprotein translocase subunit SecF